MSHLPDNDRRVDPILLMVHELRGIREQIEQHNTNNSILKRLEEMEQRIVMTQAELTAALDRMTAQTGKVAKEQSDRFDVLTTRIDELTKVIEAGGDVSPEVTTALAAAQTALDNLDAAIPDAPGQPA